MGTKISIVENFLSYNYMVLYYLYDNIKGPYKKGEKKTSKLLSPSSSLDRQPFTVVSVVEHCLC